MKRLFAIVLLVLASVFPAHAQFVGQQTWGSTSAGSANAQTITIQNAFALSDVLGVQLSYIPASANTAATTLNVSALGAVAVKKRTSAGLIALVGGELGPSQIAQVIYDGTQFQLLNPIAIPNTYQRFTNTNTTYTPTPGTTHIKVLMVAGGGAGGGTAGGGNGTAGGTSSFNTSGGNWTVIGGGGGTTAVGAAGGQPGSAGNGGTTPGSGSVLIWRTPGATGGTGVTAQTGTELTMAAGAGGGSCFGGGAGTVNGNQAATTGLAWGSGGNGGPNASIPATGTGAGGGSGECVYFAINTLVGAYNVAAGGGGTASGGGGGAPGFIEIEEFKD